MEGATLSPGSGLSIPAALVHWAPAAAPDRGAERNLNTAQNTGRDPKTGGRIRQSAQRLSRRRLSYGRHDQGPANHTLRRRDAPPHPSSMTNRECHTSASASCVPARSALQRAEPGSLLDMRTGGSANSRTAHCACALPRVAQVAEVVCGEKPVAAEAGRRGPRREGIGDEGRVDVEGQSGAVVRSGTLGDGGGGGGNWRVAMATGLRPGRAL